MLSALERERIVKEKLYWDYRENITIDVTASTGVNKSIVYKTPDSTFASGRHDFIANLGYSEDEVTSITLSLSGRGQYKIKDINVYCIPMYDYPDKVSALMKSALDNIKVENDAVTGTIELEQPKILVMAIPYSVGWKANIDGLNVPVMVANERYLGIEVPEGSHYITFSYSTPYKKLGALISVLGILIFGGVVFYFEKMSLEK